MNFIVLSTAALTYLVSMVQAADSGSFGLVAIRSGSEIQYATAYLGSDNNIYLAPTDKSAQEFHGMMYPDGRVRVGGTDQWLSTGPDGALGVHTASPTNWGTDGEDHLGTSGFTAVKGSKGYQVFTTYNQTSSDTIPFIFRIMWDGNASSGSQSATSTGGAKNSTTVVPPPSTSATSTGSKPANPTGGSTSTTIVTDCGDKGPCTKTAVPQVNGAAAAQGFVGAAAAALAGALLL